MGSSASIMQANITAGDNKNSTITFHCQELRETDPVSQVTLNRPTVPSGGAPLPKQLIFAVTDTSQRGGDKVVLGPEVTRYFPIIQPTVAAAAAAAALSPLPASTSPNKTRDLMDRAPPYIDKEKGTKENYYYSCEICNKGFMFKKSLDRHLARHPLNGKEVDETTMLPRTYPINVKSAGSVSEVRYQLKDPRLYEHHYKLQKLKAQAHSVAPGGGEMGSRSAKKLTSRSASSKPPRTTCIRCKGTGHDAEVCGMANSSPRDAFLRLASSRHTRHATDHPSRRTGLTTNNVLAICSCLKCNRSFDDVDKLKEHIPRCPGLTNKHLQQPEVR